jgi:2-(1,2-epoxy-1,2-dihydrophenyl)acetyl-CoA isomerase
MKPPRYEHIRLEIKEGVAVITFDAPAFRNALGIQAMQDVVDCFDRVEADDKVGCIVLTGAGNSWSAGFQLKEIQGVDDADAERVRLHFRKASLWWHTILHRLVRAPKPVLAAVNGVVAGGPVGMVAACDMAVCNASARFVCAWHAIGIANDAGSSYIFAKVLGFRRAMDVLLTNRTLDAKTAYDWQLVNEVYADDEFQAKWWELAKSLADGPTHLQALAKQSLHEGWNESLEKCTENEIQNVLKSIVHPHFKPRLKAFLGGSKMTTEAVRIPASGWRRA